ncbi:hypothetical protein [Streptomyces sp. SAS_270]|uniref:hypothetical protein n=1 Tax=Streptomyces sp. SAS_270 TaxID=3412748 RepID=UPI00403C3155
MDFLARDRHIGMWALDAIVYNPRHEDDPFRMYEVRDQPEEDTRRPWRHPWLWFMRLWRSAENRVVARPMSSSRDGVEAELALCQGALLDFPFDPVRHKVSEAGDSISPLLSAFASRRAQWGRLLLTIFFAAVVGALAHVVVLLIVVGVPVLLVLAWWLGEDVVPVGHPRAWRLPRGIVLVAILGCAPYLAASRQQGPQVVRGALLIIMSGLVLWLMGLAVRNSWISRNASWIVPVLLPALAVSLPWLGRLQYATYLDSGFGIPSDAVSVAIPAQYAVTQLPLISAGAMFIGVTFIVGICRYYYIPVGRDRLAISSQRVLLITGTIAAIAVPVIVGISTADNRADEARTAADADRTPEPYYGLHGRLVCVRMLQPDLPVFNGPIPAGRPILTFGSSGDQVWLWDPIAGEALSVPVDGVALERFVGGEPRCGV